MFKPQNFKGLFLIGLILVVASPILAQSESDPIIKMDIKSNVELDLGLMMEEMKPLLMDIMAMEDDEGAEAVQYFWELLGLDALDILKIEEKAKKNDASARMVLTLDPDIDGGLLSKLTTIPKGSSEFAGYLNQEDVVMYATHHNFSAMLEIIFEMLAQPEVAQSMGELPVNEEGDLSFAGFTPRTDLLPLLSGELDVFMMQPEEGAGAMSIQNMPYFMVLGANDGFALRDKILEIADTMAGGGEGGIVEMIDGLPLEMVGDFELKETPFGAAFAVNEDFLVIGMSGAPLKEILATKKGNLRVPDGHEYIYIDGQKYGLLMEEIMNMASMMSPDESGMNEILGKFYSVMFRHMESETCLTTYKPNQMIIETKVKGNTLTGLYQSLVMLMAEMPAIIEEEQRKEAEKNPFNAAQQVVGLVDEAMTAYGVDHDGLFPADPRDLVGTGYLEEFPMIEEVPAGTYFEGGYSYHTLLNEEGQIAGYFFFVYGGGEGSGYDVYTPENLADLENFVVDSDGIDDGVGGFCYDGLAFDQMDAWRNK